MVVALFFAEHRTAINSPITISSTLLPLNSLTLDYTGLLLSFSVSSIHITWLLEHAFSISRFCGSCGGVYYNKFVHQNFASLFFLFTFFCLRFDAPLSYSLFN